MSKLTSDLNNPPSKYTVGKLAELLERNGIDVDAIGRIKNVSLYQNITKDKEGVVEVHDLHAIQFSPIWEEGPEWPVVQQGPQVRLPTIKAKPAKSSRFKKAVVFPDMQIGYFKNLQGELEPTHDEVAIDLALAIAKDCQPEEIVLLGDNLDLPEMSKYRHSPAFQQTTQATVDRGALLAAQLRAAAPNARIRWLAGNHEERLINYILDNARAAFGLRKGNTPESWPVLSVPYLCRFDEYGVEYIPGYPAGSLWLNERLKIIHGTKHKSNGSTAHKYLDTEKVSVIFGHIHRREYASRTRDDWDGPKEVMAASPGCLARRTGVVPSTKGGIDLDGRPITVIEDWQAGLAVVHFEDSGDHHFVYEQVAIHDNWCMWNGKVYEA